MQDIDKSPPALTGDVNQDLSEILRYLAYLQERMNFILSLIYKRL